jgi:hypothetical protein
MTASPATTPHRERKMMLARVARGCLDLSAFKRSAGRLSCPATTVR